MSDRIARNLKIFGRVQGVFYRESMRREAELCDVSGWVKNCSDGTVEAHVEGQAQAVNAIIDWCRHGPPSAFVSNVDSAPSDATHPHGFQVLPTE